MASDLNVMDDILIACFGTVIGSVLAIVLSFFFAIYAAYDVIFNHGRNLMR